MTRVYLRIIFIFLLLLQAASIAFAQESTYELQFASMEIKPYVYMQDGQIQGESLDFLKRLCQSADCTFNTTIYPMKRLMLLMKSGAVDLSLMPEAFIDRTVFETAENSSGAVNIGLYFNPSDVDISNLNNLRIAVIKNYDYSGVLPKLMVQYPKLSLVPVKDAETTFKMLAHNRADLVLAYRDTAENLDLGDGLNYKSLFESDIYIVFSPKMKHPNPEAIIGKLNKANNLMRRKN